MPLHVPKNITAFSHPDGFTVKSYSAEKKHCIVIPQSGGNTLEGSHQFLNGAVYGFDTFVNNGKPICVGFPVIQEISHISAPKPEQPFDLDVHVRKNPPGITISVSRFDGETFIRVQTPENSFMEPPERELFSYFGMPTYYKTIIDKILSANEGFQTFLKDIGKTKTSFLHFFFKICSPSIHASAPFDIIYLIDVVNNTSNPNEPIINNLEKLYEIVKMYSFKILPFVEGVPKDSKEVCNLLYSKGDWQYVIYFNNNQNRIKITNSQYFEVSVSKKQFTLKCMTDRYIRKKQPDIKSFVSSECRSASLLNSDQDKDDALANIEQFKKNWHKLQKYKELAGYYAEGLCMERGIFDPAKTTQADKAWLSDKVGLDCQESWMKGLVWTCLNKTEISTYSATQILSKDLVTA